MFIYWKYKYEIIFANITNIAGITMYGDMNYKDSVFWDVMPCNVVKYSFILLLVFYQILTT
jgi:hypothetical protein